MAYQIKWSPRAADDLEEICCFIARDSEYYAALIASKIVGIVKTIPEFPESGRVVPEYQDDKIREKIFKNYRIIYRIKGNFIEVVAICHGMKPLDDIP